MAEPLFRVGRSRGLNSIIKGKTLDNYLRKAMEEELKPYAREEYEKYSEKFGVNEREQGSAGPVGWKINVQVGPVRGQVMTITPIGDKLAVARWFMVDKKGRKGGKTYVSRKFKTVRKKTQITTQKGISGAKKLTEKGGTYRRQVPFPMRVVYEAHTSSYGNRIPGGSGLYQEDWLDEFGVPGGEGYETVFSTKFTQGKVTPIYITRDKLAPKIRKEATRVIENAYRRAFLAIKGRGI